MPALGDTRELGNLGEQELRDSIPTLVPDLAEAQAPAPPTLPPTPGLGTRSTGPHPVLLFSLISPEPPST